MIMLRPLLPNNSSSSSVRRPENRRGRGGFQASAEKYPSGFTYYVSDVGRLFFFDRSRKRKDLNRNPPPPQKTRSARSVTKQLCWGGYSIPHQPHSARTFRLQRRSLLSPFFVGPSCPPSLYLAWPAPLSHACRLDGCSSGEAPSP